MADPLNQRAARALQLAQERSARRNSKHRFRAQWVQAVSQYLARPLSESTYKGWEEASSQVPAAGLIAAAKAAGVTVDDLLKADVQPSPEASWSAADVRLLHELSEQVAKLMRRFPLEEEPG